MLSALLLLQFVIIAQSISQNVRSLYLSEMIDMKYQCTNAACAPPTIIVVSSLRDCQYACFVDAQCRTGSFYQSIHQCELFTDIPGQYGILLAQANVITVTAIDDRQLSVRPSFNWLINGDGEQGPCESGSAVTHPTGWNYDGTMTQIYYSIAGGDLMYTNPGPSDRGNCYFYGQHQVVTSMWQTVNMTRSINPSLIDNQTVWFNFSAWIGGYGDQDDNAKASLIFTNQANQQVGNSTNLGPVLAADRGNTSSLLFQQANGPVPINARFFTVTVTMTLMSGADNDGCIDNIAVLFYQ